MSPPMESADPDAAALATHCPNCGALRDGSYCSGCGQRRSARITLRGTWRDGLERLTELDFALVRTVGALSTRPGPMVREYLSGRRQRYTPPLKYAFIVITAFALAIHLLDIDLRLAGAPVESARDLAAIDLIAGLSVYLFFPTAAIAAVLVWRLHTQFPLNYAEALVLTAYAFTHVHFWNLLVGMTLGYRQWPGTLALLAGQVAYLAWTLRGCVGVRWRRAIGEAAGLTVAWLMMFNLLAWSLANVAAVMGRL